jgi:hypothetical protein
VRTHTKGRGKEIALQHRREQRIRTKENEGKESEGEHGALGKEKADAGAQVPLRDGPTRL